MRDIKALYATAIVLSSAVAWASSVCAEESIEGVTSTYGWIDVSDSYRLRLIETRPANARGALPLIYFVQWLSCDSIEISERNDGWTQMLRGLVTGGRYSVARVDKAGVGDSGGPPCNKLDYNTELRHHSEALEQLLERRDIDGNRVVIFGASMGATMAPLLVNVHDVAGVATWGGGTVTWFERLLAFDRHALEFGGTDGSSIAAQMSRNIAFYQQYLLDQKTPMEIVSATAEMKQVVDGIIGLSETDHYGRPFSFHHQAQSQNWQGAWSQIEVPALVLFGEFDWFETESSHRSIVQTINQKSPGGAQLAIIENMDHHFSLFSDPVAAFEDSTGTPDAEPFLRVLLPWLNETLSN